jgi:hypothetical protein
MNEDYRSYRAQLGWLVAVVSLAAIGLILIGVAIGIMVTQ